MNIRGVWAIYTFEMARALRTLAQTLVSPVLSTSLYFVVFGSAIGSRMSEIEGVPYSSFIVPGLMMLSLLTQSVSNASFGIFMPRFSGTIYEVLSAPLSPFEMTLGFVGAAATKALIVSGLIFLTAHAFVSVSVLHPLWMLLILTFTALTFSLLGFIVGLWADSFEKLSVTPLLIITPLTFLGGTFYSISMLPPLWQTLSLFNPVVYLVGALRWSFFGNLDVSIQVCVAVMVGFLLACTGILALLFKTGYRLRG